MSEDRDKNLQDVLVHLYEWHQYDRKMARCRHFLQGGSLYFLGEGYIWKTLPNLNMEKISRGISFGFKKNA